MRPSYKTRWNRSKRSQQLFKFIGAKTRVSFNVRKMLKNHIYTNMAALSLFWNTNMADVKSCELTLCSCSLESESEKHEIFRTSRASLCYPWYREEKSLSHVPMVAKFLIDRNPKIHLKREFALFQT